VCVWGGVGAQYCSLSSLTPVLSDRPNNFGDFISEAKPLTTAFMATSSCSYLHICLNYAFLGLKLPFLRLKCKKIMQIYYTCTIFISYLWQISPYKHQYSEIILIFDRFTSVKYYEIGEICTCTETEKPTYRDAKRTPGQGGSIWWFNIE
jgi:hypothetical protein